MPRTKSYTPRTAGEFVRSLEASTAACEGDGTTSRDKDRSRQQRRGKYGLNEGGDEKTIMKLFSDQYIDQIRATEAVAFMTRNSSCWESHSQIACKVINLGCLPRLVGSLRSKNIGLVYLAAEVLGNICTSRARTRLVLQANAKSALIECLDHTSPRVQEKALFALGRIYQWCDYGMGRYSFLPDDLSPLLSFTKDSLDLPLLRGISYALASATTVVKPEWMFIIAYDLAKLHHFLASHIYTEDDEVLKHITTGLCSLSKHKQEHSFFIQYGICRRLVQLLQNDVVQEKVGECIYNLSAGTLETRQTIINCGCLSTLLGLIHPLTRPKLQETAYKIICKLASAGSIYQVQAIIRANAVPYLIDILENRYELPDYQDELRDLICNAVCVIARNVDGEHIKYLIARGCVSALCKEMGGSISDETKSAILDALDNFVDVWDKLKRKERHDIRDFARHIAVARDVLNMYRSRAQ
ncbi:3624_t:CDS:2 [Paraglomus brasilianum]|uniref:3624_t:CDS:1 n=1 Tax=Paraglomus brasilianum TaxID=144538 RepID=A0A9N8ZA29_9GLOM|nr:3624_t:CDS:2 [Paraglomus brasilianum]